jgi:N-acetylglutamate synthase-like GNAT family acetyltransferase
VADIRRLDGPADLSWVVQTNAEVYAQEFGWDASYATLVARIVEEFATSTSSRQAGWIAEHRGERIGCVMLVEEDDRTARLRLLLVHPDGRGQGLGGRLIDTALEHARAVGYEETVLWTNHPLAAARHLYLERGFVLVQEEQHHSFGVDLVGQTYRLSLHATSAPPGVVLEA